MRSTIALIVLVQFSSLAQSVDYCEDQYDCTVQGESYKHVMCYPLPGKDVCEYFGVLGYDPVRSVMLKLHNTLRAEMTDEYYARSFQWPTACNLSELTWNSKNAWIAERWLKSCSLNIGQCRGSKPGETAGQNWDRVLVSDPSRHDPLRIMESLFYKWYNSIHDGATNSDNFVDNYRNGSWAAGSQILWGKTVSVGCAFIGYKLTEEGAKTKTYLALACNYSPAGNIPGQHIYETKGCDEAPSTLNPASALKPISTLKPSTTANPTPSVGPILESTLEPFSGPSSEATFEPESTAELTTSAVQQVLDYRYDYDGPPIHSSVPVPVPGTNDSLSHPGSPCSYLVVMNIILICMISPAAGW